MKKYAYAPTDAEITEQWQSLAAVLPALQTRKNYVQCLACMDLTTLSATDTMAKGASLARKVNDFDAKFNRPESAEKLPDVAAVCIYPALIPAVRKTLKAPGVKIAATGAGFPASQTFTAIKEEECRLCVAAGADEVDIVLSLNYFLGGDYEAAGDEIRRIKQAVGDASLKVILESGTLGTARNIATASFIAMESGADKIKTSTGKSSPAATPEAAIVMCHCIKKFYEYSGKKVGFKPAGGIVAAEEAIMYLAIVKEILGPEWLNPELFRIGASRLANNLLSAILKRPVKYY